MEELQACKSHLEEKAPKGTSFIAFMSANMNEKPWEELNEDIRAFSEVFPRVPVMGSLDLDRDRISDSIVLYRFAILIVGFIPD